VTFSFAASCTPFGVAERHISRLELGQESQQIRVIAPVLPFSFGSAHPEGLRFHFQIYFGVDIGGLNRRVAEPGADGIDIDSGTKKVRGGVWRIVCGPMRFLRNAG
jgi:hypothetical protein